MKLDGWRLQVRVEDGRAVIRTRKGLDYTRTFPELAKAARGLDNCIIDGEICSVDGKGVTDFSALQAAMKSSKTDRLVYFAFDVLFLDGVDLRSRRRATKMVTTASMIASGTTMGGINQTLKPLAPKEKAVRNGVINKSKVNKAHGRY